MFQTKELDEWLDLPFFKDQLPKIASKLDDVSILPPSELTFAALRLCPPSNCEVIILGQDPYHTPGKADGLAFSIPTEFGGRLDSLGNIFKELNDDLNARRTKTSLDDWAKQGVLLLNTALSVLPGQAKAHSNIGWSDLIVQVLQRLDDRPRAVVLWGGPAQVYANYLKNDHLILTSAHPSPLSAYRGFFGSRPFSRVNQWLTTQGKTPIRWADP